MSLRETGQSRANILAQSSHSFFVQKSIKAGLSRMLVECLEILYQMQGHQFGFFFKWPVNPYALKLERYWQIVKKPMDLMTIRHKIINKFYKTSLDFDKDMNLMISNSQLYNKDNKEIMHKISQFKKDYQQLFGNRRVNIQALEREQINNREKALQIFLDNYFTEQKRGEIGQILSKFDEKSRSILVQTIKEKFPSIKIHNSNIMLSSLTGIQMKFIFDLIASQKKIGKITRHLPPNQVKKKAKRDEESSFEIEEESK